MTTESTTTVIGGDTHFKGELTYDGSARILGRFEGAITTKGDLHIAEGASCKAQITVGSATIDGAVEGNLTATGVVQLNATSKLVGDLAAGKLIVAEGATFTGQVQVGTETVHTPAPPPEPTDKPAAAASRSAPAEPRPQPRSGGSR